MMTELHGIHHEFRDGKLYGKAVILSNPGGLSMPFVEWEIIDKSTHIEDLGMLLEFLRIDDSRPAKAQIEDRYSHGGG